LCAGIASQFLYRAQKNVFYRQTLCDKTKIDMQDNISSIYEIKEKKNKGFKSGFSLTLFFSGLREASPPAP
jgi:hypothetical protein